MVNVRSCHKERTEGGGRDLAGSRKQMGGEFLANKFFLVITMGHEARRLSHSAIVSNTSESLPAALLVIDNVLYP